MNIESLLVSFDTLYHGIGSQKLDKKKALELLKHAKDLGSPFANAWFASRHDKQTWQILQEAVQWFQKSAEQGYADAQLHLGVALEDAFGVAQDLELAAKWYKKAAKQGHAFAIYNLGLCYYDGCGVLKDIPAAVKFYREAAEQGEVNAQNCLSRCYQFGYGVTQDDENAIKWNIEAANAGFADAQNDLGQCYEEGTCVDLNMQIAVSYYKMAAEQGHDIAQGCLGKCYQAGHGVEKDLTIALKWLRLACDSDPIAHSTALIYCLEEVAASSGDRAEAADLLWEASILLGNVKGIMENRRAISRAFWCHTLPPLRIIAARAVILADESTRAFHEGIRDEIELVRKSLRATGFYKL